MSNDLIGKPVSREEALRISRTILERAEAERNNAPSEGTSEAARIEQLEADLAAARSEIEALKTAAMLGRFICEHMPTQAYVARRLMMTYPKDTAVSMTKEAQS